MESNNQKIDVLNHGFVRLVSHMQPAVQSEGWSGDLEIVRNARVSYDADWRTGEKAGADKGLINYMYNNGHTSPFEAMVFTFEVQVPIFITRQWHRHRTWSYNEVSARYAELPDVFFLPEVDRVGVQSKDNKQMSDFDDGLTEAEKVQVENQIKMLEKDFESAYKAYQGFVEMGWPRERARTVLPVGIYTRFFATVDLHNLFHFLTLRLHEHAQYEIRVYAEAMLELITPIVPMSVEAFHNKRLEDEAIDYIKKLCKEHKLNTAEVLTQLGIDLAQEIASS